jgi:hypothetical protein
MRKSHSEHFSTAVPQKADIARRGWHGRKVPKAVVSRCSNMRARKAELFDHLVGAREHGRRNFEAERQPDGCGQARRGWEADLTPFGEALTPLKN